MFYNRSIKIIFGLALAAAAVVGLTTATVSQNNQAASVARGKYLANNVGMCLDCHGEAYKGQALPFKAIDPKIPFMPLAPGIRKADLDGKKYTQASLSKVLQTGKRVNGDPFIKPMPSYKMNKQDADDVAAYLFSLK